MNVKQRFLGGLIATFAALAVAAPASASNIDKIVFFGDSLSDTGNVWYATGGFPAPPYNQGSGGAGPDFTGGQWSDPLGPSWPTVFASMYGLAATPSLVPGGNNYAWGGARTGVNTGAGGVPWLDQQVALYQGDLIAGTGTPATPTTLASIMIGGNDIANNLGNPGAIVSGISSIVTQVINLYTTGIRQFLVANVPDVGATPTFQALDAATPGVAFLATATTVAWNAALQAALSALSLPGADIDYLDLFSLGKDPAVLAHFANTTDACLTPAGVCADPASYFYWDPFHPSSTTHALIAGAAFTAVPEPGTLALLGLCMLGLGLARRRKQS